MWEGVKEKATDSGKLQKEGKENVTSIGEVV